MFRERCIRAPRDCLERVFWFALDMFVKSRFRDIAIDCESGLGPEMFEWINVLYLFEWRTEQRPAIYTW